MARPFEMYSALDAYKYECIENGADIEYFHCYNDRKGILGKVFDIIAGNLSAVYVDSLIVEKRKTDPALTVDNRFYPEMLGNLLKYVLPRDPNPGASEVIIITDTIPVNKKRRAVEKAVRTTLSDVLPRTKYRILHHQSRSHYGLQIADYCCWAMFRKYERGDLAYLNRIGRAVRSEFDIFRTGTTYYY